MADLRSLALARQRGEESRSIDLVLSEASEIDLSAQDIGPCVRAFWGDGDYEFGIKIAATDAPLLAFALIAEHYGDDPEAVDRVCALADRYGIDTNFWSWA